MSGEANESNEIQEMLSKSKSNDFSSNYNTPDKDWITSNDNKKILAIIPCYNEEATISSVILKTRRYVDEILIVDDGSIDETVSLSKELGATVICHKINKGKNAAVKTGFRYALEHNFEYIVTLDGDGQHNPDEIPELIGPLINNNNTIDISLGIRSGKNTEMPLWRRFGKRALDYATSFGNDGFITDSQCGFRAFNNKAVKGITPKLQGKSFSVESEQLISAHQLGLEISQTNVSCRYQDLDTSTKGPTAHGFSVLGYIIFLIAEKHPLLFIGLPGFIFVIFGFLSGLYTLQYYNAHNIFLFSYAILTAILLIIGVVALFMGLVFNVLPHIIKRAKEESE